MIHRMLLNTLLAALSSLGVASLALGDDSPQVAAIRAFQKAAEAKDWANFYEEYCHPHLQKQIASDDFAKFMDGDGGKAIVGMIHDILVAVDAEADAATLISQETPDEKTEYEFILVKIRRKPTRKRQQWHLELKLDNNKWKLLDTD